MDPLDQIAAGHDPEWRRTFSHPTHGDLEFAVTRGLCNRDWLRHSAVLDRIVRDNGGDPNDASARTTIFAAACAGILEITERPVLEERRTPDPENEDHEQVEIVRYDPLADDDREFPITVWNSFMLWRQEIQERAHELGKDSGETHGDASAGSSPAAMVSPSTTRD